MSVRAPSAGCLSRCFGAGWAPPGLLAGGGSSSGWEATPIGLLTLRWQQPAASLHEIQRDRSPEMITLYGFGTGFGLPEISPFVTKTEVQLKMAGLAYAKEKAMPPSSPKGQMPYIDDDGKLVADTTFIRAHIERKYGLDFDEGLSLRQRAQAWAFERMI